MSQTTPCQCIREETPEGWYTHDYDDSWWADVSQYEDQTVSKWSIRQFVFFSLFLQVGWGSSPTPGDGLIDPQDVDWGESSFIWGPDLYLHNRVLFRYSTC